jgi:hypothetical protein
VVLAKNQALPRLAQGRIRLRRCWARLPDGLEAGSARPAVAGTMGDGGLQFYGLVQLCRQYGRFRSLREGATLNICLKITLGLSVIVCGCAPKLPPQAIFDSNDLSSQIDDDAADVTTSYEETAIDIYSSSDDEVAGPTTCADFLVAAPSTVVFYCAKKNQTRGFTIKNVCPLPVEVASISMTGELQDSSKISVYWGMLGSASPGFWSGGGGSSSLCGGCDVNGYVTYLDDAPQVTYKTWDIVIQYADPKMEPFKLPVVVQQCGK